MATFSYDGESCRKNRYEAGHLIKVRWAALCTERLTETELPAASFARAKANLSVPGLPHQSLHRTATGFSARLISEASRSKSPGKSSCRRGAFLELGRGRLNGPRCPSPARRATLRLERPGRPVIANGMQTCVDGPAPRLCVFPGVDSRNPHAPSRHARADGRGEPTLPPRPANTRSSGDDNMETVDADPPLHRRRHSRLRVDRPVFIEICDSRPVNRSDWQDIAFRPSPKTLARLAEVATPHAVRHFRSSKQPFEYINLPIKAAYFVPDELFRPTADSFCRGSRALAGLRARLKSPATCLATFQTRSKAAQVGFRPCARPDRSKGRRRSDCRCVRAPGELRR